jgi:C4-dicarboxylate-specific signal transduction histidine kinase
MATFLTEDPKGKQLPSFVIAISGGLKEEREKLQAEIELLIKNIEHIKVIISVQQDHAKACRLVEDVELGDLLRDALYVNKVGLEQARVRVVQQLADMPRLTTEKHKLLQILVNLVSNAKHAMSITSGRERVLTLSTRVVEERMVEIRVTDNGIGIPKDNLRKIFQHGFTTRSEGHGFGLHGSAIAATQMQGSLTVESAGTDQGATFLLELPIRAAGVGLVGGEDTEEASGVTLREPGAATA